MAKKPAVKAAPKMPPWMKPMAPAKKGAGKMPAKKGGKC